MNCPECNYTLRDGARYCDNCGRALTELAVQDCIRNRDPWLGKTIGEKYQILALLGEGGVGAVYRARRILIGDEVAMKVLRPQYVEEDRTVERFRREAQAAAMLHHPTVVAIYDFSEARGDEPAY